MQNKYSFHNGLLLRSSITKEVNLIKNNASKDNNRCRQHKMALPCDAGQTNQQLRAARLVLAKALPTSKRPMLLTRSR